MSDKAMDWNDTITRDPRPEVNTGPAVPPPAGPQQENGEEYLGESARLSAADLETLFRASRSARRSQSRPRRRPRTLSSQPEVKLLLDSQQGVPLLAVRQEPQRLRLPRLSPKHRTLTPPRHPRIIQSTSACAVTTC